MTITTMMKEQPHRITVQRENPSFMDVPQLSNKISNSVNAMMHFGSIHSYTDSSFIFYFFLVLKIFFISVRFHEWEDES